MKILIAALLCVTCIVTKAQTVEEVIQKYSTALGGLSAFNNVKSAKMTGTVTTAGKTFPLTTQLINGKAMRTDVVAVGQQVINVYNDGKGWKINPFANAPTATDVTGAELISFKAQSSLANHLADYKKRGHQVELLGQEPVNGINAYKIKLVNKDDGKTTIYYIDANSFLLIKSTSKREISGEEYDAETLYTDIREINGLKFCMHITVTALGKPYQEISYEKIELNVPVDEKIFIRPKS